MATSLFPTFVSVGTPYTVESVRYLYGAFEGVRKTYTRRDVEIELNHTYDLQAGYVLRIHSTGEITGVTCTKDGGNFGAVTFTQKTQGGVDYWFADINMDRTYNSSVVITPIIAAPPYSAPVELTLNDIGKDYIAEIVEMVEGEYGSVLSVLNLGLNEFQSDQFSDYVIRLTPVNGIMTNVNFTDNATSPTFPAIDFINKTDGSWYSEIKAVNMENPAIISITPEIFIEGTDRPPFNSIFLAKPLTLESLVDVWIYKPFDGPLVDNTPFVISVLQIPIPIPVQFIGSENEIKLGFDSTGVFADSLNSDLIKFNLGTIDVAEIGNSLDFFEHRIELSLPFFSNKIQLDAVDVVGKSIKIEYLLDAYTGKTTVNIFNGNNEPFKSIDFKIGRKVPLKTNFANDSSISIDGGSYNDLRIAFISSYKPVLVDNYFNRLVSNSGIIGNVFSGYVEVEKIKLDSISSLEHRKEIERILKNGVIIK